MDKEEILKNLELIKAAIEWETDIYNQVVLDDAIKHINAFYELKEKMVKYREQMLFSHNYSYAAMTDKWISIMDNLIEGK